MKKFIVVTPSVLGLLLFSGMSYAGNGMKRTAEFVVTHEAMSMPNAATVDCTTLVDCTWISSMPAEGDHNPAIQFMLGEDQMVHVEAGIWGMLGCPGSPDAVAAGDLALTAGLNTIRIVFSPPIADGEFLSMQWVLGSCPLTACADYPSLGTPPPAFCNPPM